MLAMCYSMLKLKYFVTLDKGSFEKQQWLTGGVFKNLLNTHTHIYDNPS